MSTTAPTVQSAPSVQQFLTAGAVVFGAVGAVAPRLLHRTYGTGDVDAGGLHMTQLWGTAVMATGVLGLMAPPEDRQRALATAAVMNVTNALFATTASGLPARTRVGSAVSSAVFAAAATYGALAAD